MPYEAIGDILRSNRALAFLSDGSLGLGIELKAIVAFLILSVSGGCDSPPVKLDTRVAETIDNLDPFRVKMSPVAGGPPDPNFSTLVFWRLTVMRFLLFFRITTPPTDFKRRSFNKDGP